MKTLISITTLSLLLAGGAFAHGPENHQNNGTAHPHSNQQMPGGGHGPGMGNQQMPGGGHGPGMGNQQMPGGGHGPGMSNDQMDKMMESNHGISKGIEGKSADVSLTFNVSLKGAPGGKMLIEPNIYKIKKGQTVRFSVVNSADVAHEFVIDTQMSNVRHKVMMQKFPEMEHDNPNSVRLEPGKKGEIIWKFTHEGVLEAACLIPGHYESGMKAVIKVGS